ncbi:MAG: Gx transporter family protein [Oscillospiraceae bacterium]
MKARKVALYGVLIALALVLSYLESLVPLSFAVPGIKMGLPNIVIVYALYALGFKDAALISLLRVLLVSILFGNVMSLAYSLAGAVLSLLVMLLLVKSGKFGTTGVSVAGAVAHNAGQILMAMLLLETAQISFYLPVLCVSGTVAGICVGLLSAVLLKRIRPKKP